MKIAKLLIISAALAPGFAIAKASYLKCELVSAPKYQQFTSQRQKDAFLAGILDKGMMGFVVPPSATWKVDIDGGQVEDLENGPRWTVKNLKVTEGFIEGKTEFGSDFLLSRVTGQLSYIKYSGTENFVLEGITVPTYGVWVYQCSATDERVV
ncbi:hypothetical protein D7Y53_22030 [Stenotrophomonas maltophilia]|uniref:hypothetical protein n=1 Tax=Stenotrophomonas TaxID=40323 RepID=UPI0015DFEC7C|nr:MULTISPECIES: hypothetical protein [Stenotrophomonas]MBA0432593.1 hypothetical protein [Stenotrophomonas maltophilia]MCX2920612.1 hypothetical protein [Stenotrophomonas rhizophila]